MAYTKFCKMSHSPNKDIIPDHDGKYSYLAKLQSWGDRYMGDSDLKARTKKEKKITQLLQSNQV